MSIFLPSDGDFSTKEWINESLRAAPASCEPLDLRLSVLLTRLRLSAADVDAEVQLGAVAMQALAPTAIREIGLVREQTGTVRSELGALFDEVGALEDRSEGAVSPLRQVLVARQQFAEVDGTLRKAENVSSLLRSAESAFGRNDAAASAADVAAVSAALDALGEAQQQALFPHAASRVTALRSLLLKKMQPALLACMREHDAEVMQKLSAQFHALGREAEFREAYVQCQQGPLFESWNAARRTDPGAGAVRSLWATIEGLVPVEAAWNGKVFSTGRSLLAEILAESLDAIGPQLEATLLEALPAAPPAAPRGSAAWSPAAADPSPAADGVDGLGELWKEALHRVAALGAQLRESGAEPSEPLAYAERATVRRVEQSLLACFAASQRKHPASLAAPLGHALPQIGPPPRDGSEPPVAHLSSEVERTTREILEVLAAAARRAVAYAGCLGATELCILHAQLVQAHATAIGARLPAAGATEAAAAEAAAADSVSARDALGLVRAVRELRLALDGAEASTVSQLRRAAAECAAAPLQSAAQRAAAAELQAALALADPGGAGGGPLAPLGRARASLDALMRGAQRLALASLSAPLAAAFAPISGSALCETWHGAWEEPTRSDATAVCPSPLEYVTYAGELLLAVPLQLEPFLGDNTLAGLAPELRAPAAEGDDGGGDGDCGDNDGGCGWLAAVAASCVRLLLAEVSKLAAFSPLGSKQMAADVSYLSNVLSAGLSLAPDSRLAELEAVLLAPLGAHSAGDGCEGEPGAVREAVAAATTLPAGLAAAVAAKRGAVLGEKVIDAALGPYGAQNCAHSKPLDTRH